MVEKMEKIDKVSLIFCFFFLLVLISFLGIMAVKFLQNSYTMNDSQICEYSNAVLIGGNCHSECDTPVKDKRSILLMVGISFIIFVILLVFYGMALIKNFYKKNEKKKNNP